MNSVSIAVSLRGNFYLSGMPERWGPSLSAVRTSLSCLVRTWGAQSLSFGGNFTSFGRGFKK